MIHIQNLWKKFGDLQVLSGLNLDINEGETLVILGPSGIGKSVLLKHIIGINNSRFIHSDSGDRKPLLL